LGSGPGQFEALVGIATDSQGRVYASELFPADRVQVFGPQPPTIEDLLVALHALGLPAGTEKALAVKLEGAGKDVAKATGGGACGKLGAFRSQLAALGGKKVPADAAAVLAGMAEETAHSLGCDS
jgi:hypothetical protein